MSIGFNEHARSASFCVGSSVLAAWSTHTSYPRSHLIIESSSGILVFHREIFNLHMTHSKHDSDSNGQAGSQSSAETKTAVEPDSLFIELGGAAGVESLVREFYRQMDTLPEAKPIRAMHPQNLDMAIEKLYFFLSGWMGGPQLYWEKYGHPQLRKRHLPFPIGTSERDQWLLCMTRALDVRKVEPAKAKFLMAALHRVAHHMINQPDQPT